MKRAMLALLAAALLTAIAVLLDPWVWRQIRYPSVYDHDWGRLLRVMGSLVLWIPLAIAVRLESRRDAAWLLLAAPALAGAAGELLKLLVRRERPGLHEGDYVYRGFAERPFDTHDFGFPSSHVVVAFAGAAVLARLYPRAGLLVYLLALGCAATRVLAQAHFLSDVVAGGIAGWTIGALLCRRLKPGMV